MILISSKTTKLGSVTVQKNITHWINGRKLTTDKRINNKYNLKVKWPEYLSLSKESYIFLFLEITATKVNNFLPPFFLLCLSKSKIHYRIITQLYGVNHKAKIDFVLHQATTTTVPVV